MPTDNNAGLKKVSNAEIVALLDHYNLYATSNGGVRHALVVDGKSMLEEVKRRLLEDPRIIKDPKVLLAPLHIQMNALGQGEGQIKEGLWGALFEIGERGFWPLGFQELTDAYEEIMRSMYQHEVFDLFKDNLVVLSITGHDQPPMATEDQRVSFLIFPTPYQGWYIHVLSKEHHVGMSQEDFCRRGFFNLQPTPSNKLDVI